MSIFGKSCDSFKHTKEDSPHLNPQERLFIKENLQLKELNRELVNRLERMELEIDILGGTNPYKVCANNLLMKSDLKVSEEPKVSQEGKT